MLERCTSCACDCWCAATRGGGGGGGGADFKLVVTRAYCELAEEALRFLFDELVCTTRDIAVAAVGSIVVVAVEEEEEMLSSSSDEVA